MRPIALFTGLLVALALPTLADNPYSKPDDTWVNVSGTVTTVETDAFTLDYGDGSILVEMDDGDRDADAYKLVKGDKVTVSGLIDDDFFEMKKIEAGSVYVENLGTYFYSSAVDEEDTFVTYTTPVVVASMTLQGKVTDVDTKAKEFTLDTGDRALRVEVDEMAYDPLDDEGYQKVEIGDRVSVSGMTDVDLFEGRRFEAESLLVLDRRS